MPFTIPAEVHSDDHKVQAAFDALPYFMQASDDDLFELGFCGFGGDYPADAVAQYVANSDEGVGRVFTYLSFEPENFGKRVGFECYIEKLPATEWIREHRPKVYQRLIDEERIDATKHEKTDSADVD